MLAVATHTAALQPCVNHRYPRIVPEQRSGRFVRVYSWGVVSASRDSSYCYRLAHRVLSEVAAMPVTDVEIEVYRQRRASITQSLRGLYQRMARLRAKIEELETAQRRLDRCEVELFERYNATRQSRATGATRAIAE